MAALELFDGQSGTASGARHEGVCSERSVLADRQPHNRAVVQERCQTISRSSPTVNKSFPRMFSRGARSLSPIPGTRQKQPTNILIGEPNGRDSRDLPCHRHSDSNASLSADQKHSHLVSENITAMSVLTLATDSHLGKRAASFQAPPRTTGRDTIESTCTSKIDGHRRRSRPRGAALATTKYSCKAKIAVLEYECVTTHAHT
jgi:hypothetical protein